MNIKDLLNLISRISFTGPGGVEKIVKVLRELVKKFNTVVTEEEIGEILSSYYTKEEVQTILSGYVTDTQIQAYYTKEQVDLIISALGKSSYRVAWDGSSQPVVANIPAGVVVTYNDTDYTGTLSASTDTINRIYLVGQDMYVTSKDDNIYSWVFAGTTELDLTDYATKDELAQLEHKLNTIDLSGDAVVLSAPEPNEAPFISSAGALSTTTSLDKAVLYVPIPKGKIHLTIPKCGNQYNSFYALSNDRIGFNSIFPYHNGPSDNSLNKEFTIDNTQYNYLYVCYVPSVGTPTIIWEDVWPGDIKPGVVKTEKIADGAVTSPKIADGAIGTEKIADNAVTVEKYEPEIITTYTGADADYRGDIAELYAVAPIESGRRYCVKFFNGKIYFRSKYENQQAFPTNYWEAQNNITSWVDNRVYPLVCTTGNATLGVSVGDIVGYIVFKDIASFRSKSSTAIGYNLLDKAVRDIRFAPAIVSYLSPNDIPDNSITTQKIANGAVTSEKLAAGIVPNPAIDINVPDVIYAVVGDKLQLYYESIFKVVNPFVFDIKVSCNIGSQYPRYFEVTPKLANVGDYTLTFVIKNYNGDTLGTKSCTLRVVESTASPSVNVLCVGASTTVGGEWVGEMKKRLTTNAGTPTKNSGGSTIFTPTGFNLPNVNFVGRKEVDGVKLEATGGYNFNSYNGVSTYIAHFYFIEENLPEVSLGDVYSDGVHQFTVTEINIPSTTGGYAGNLGFTCPDKPHTANLSLTKVSGNGDASLTASLFDFKGNPFLYDGVIDVEQYAEDYCGGQIDVVLAYLFSNGIITPYQTDFTTALASMRTFINNITTAFPNCRFGILLSQNKDARGGLGVDYGAAESNIWTYEFGMKVANHNLLTALQEYITEENLTNVFIVNILNEFDYWNDYQQTTKQVNPRSGATEIFGRNGVHPSVIGYYQIADSATRAFIGKYNES